MLTKTHKKVIRGHKTRKTKDFLAWLTGAYMGDGHERRGRARGGERGREQQH